MNKYEYHGPVMELSRYVEYNGKAETMAPSATKARSNLT